MKFGSYQGSMSVLVGTKFHCDQISNIWTVMDTNIIKFGTQWNYI